MKTELPKSYLLLEAVIVEITAFFVFAGHNGLMCTLSVILFDTQQVMYYFAAVLLLTERERDIFYLTTHSTHFIYGYMASDIWLRTILIVRKETRCRHIGYSYRLTARVLLHAPSNRQDSTYHGICYTSR